VDLSTNTPSSPALAIPPNFLNRSIDVGRPARHITARQAIKPFPYRNTYGSREKYQIPSLHPSHHRHHANELANSHTFPQSTEHRAQSTSSHLTRTIRTHRIPPPVSPQNLYTKPFARRKTYTSQTPTIHNGTVEALFTLNPRTLHNLQTSHTSHTHTSHTPYTPHIRFAIARAYQALPFTSQGMIVVQLDLQLKHPATQMAHRPHFSPFSTFSSVCSFLLTRGTAFHFYVCNGKIISSVLNTFSQDLFFSLLRWRESANHQSHKSWDSHPSCRRHTHASPHRFLVPAFRFVRMAIMVTHQKVR